MFEKSLKDIGLSDKEAAVYLHLLNSDKTLIAEIAEATKIKRPTVYTILESLAKKGLVSETTAGTKTKYQAEPAERLETFVERQKILFEEKTKILKDAIPELKTMQRESSGKPIVRYYEGKEGAISSLEELFSNKEKGEETVYFIYPRDEVEAVWSEEDRKKYQNKRLTIGLKPRTLYTWSKDESFKPEDGAIRIKIDRNKYPLKADIAIYGDKIKIHTLSDKLSGIFIQNKDVATTLKSLINWIIDHSK